MCVEVSMFLCTEAVGEGVVQCTEVLLCLFLCVRVRVYVSVHRLYYVLLHMHMCVCTCVYKVVSCF